MIDLECYNHIEYSEKDPAEAVHPLPAKEVQPATGAAETVLLCHHRDCPVFIYHISQKGVHPSHFCEYFIIYFHVTTLQRLHFATM